MLNDGRLGSIKVNSEQDGLQSMGKEEGGRVASDARSGARAGNVTDQVSQVTSFFRSTPTSNDT